VLLYTFWALPLWMRRKTFAVRIPSRMLRDDRGSRVLRARG
jgi:hypothetical protein